MREFLIIKLVCSKCGNNLRLTYDKPKVPADSERYADGEPTGAKMVQQLVVVEPCECSTRPLEEMRRAAKTLLSA